MAEGLMGWLKSLKSGAPKGHPQDCDDADLPEMTLRGTDFNRRLEAFKERMKKDVHHEN